MAALKGSCDGSFVRQPATIAEGGLNESHFCAALVANKSLRRVGSFLVAKLADFRIKEVKGGVEPGF